MLDHHLYKMMEDFGIPPLTVDQGPLSSARAPVELGANNSTDETQAEQPFNQNSVLSNRADPTRRRSETIDLGHDDSLQVEISDAVSEKDKVKFTINTRTTLPEFRKSEFSVIREHEEFIWLQERFVENEMYTGYIVSCTLFLAKFPFFRQVLNLILFHTVVWQIPPPPPHPDFESSRRKLQQLGESEGLMTKDEFNKFKQDLEAEYLALFKKTVSMHETFLKRIAQHPIMRKDHYFQVFLEYDQDVSLAGGSRSTFDWFACIILFVSITAERAREK